MKPFVQNFPASGVAVVAALYTSVAAASLPLTVTPYVMTDGIARNVTLTSANDQSAISFVISGFNSSNQFVSETLVGPTAAATVTSANTYVSVYSIVSTAAVTAISAGTPAAVTGKWMQLDVDVPYFQAVIQVQMEAGGDATTYSVTQSFDDTFTDPTPLAWPVDASLTTQTTSKAFTMTGPANSVRLSIASGTKPITFTVLQQG